MVLGKSNNLHIITATVVEHILSGLEKDLETVGPVFGNDDLEAPRRSRAGWENLGLPRPFALSLSSHSHHIGAL